MDIITSIFSVFSETGKWLIQFIPTLISLFWNEGSGETPGSLTFLGILALIGLSISVFFLIMGLIQNFLHFRGQSHVKTHFYVLLPFPSFVYFYGSGRFFMNTVYELFIRLFSFYESFSYQPVFSLVAIFFSALTVAAPLYFIYRIFRRLF